MLDIEIVGAGACPMDVGDFEGFLFAGEVRGFIEGGSCVLERNKPVAKTTMIPIPVMKARTTKRTTLLDWVTA
ncbi:MAG: hypothetical protein IPP17_04090 [Bacteroidetes bacterium]|nr:hypothetical protein [Bacteroidota bacterium]